MIKKPMYDVYRVYVFYEYIGHTIIIFDNSFIEILVSVCVYTTYKYGTAFVVPTHFQYTLHIGSCPIVLSILGIFFNFIARAVREIVHHSPV